MKKIVLLLLISFNSLAENPFEKPKQNELGFDKLEQIENYIRENPEMDFKEMKLSNMNMLDNIDLSEQTFIDQDFENPLGIPPFFWGCVLGFLGIILVYVLSDKDKDATKRALLGCVVTYGTFTLVYLVLILLYAGIHTY